MARKQAFMKRFVKTSAVTLARFIFEEFVCWTVEKGWNDNIPFESCISDGTYIMRRFVDEQGYQSSKNTKGHSAWEICNVTGRTLIVVHVANKPSELLGCVSLGEGLYGNLQGVSSSGNAINEFYGLTKDLDEMEIVIETGVLC